MICPVSTAPYLSHSDEPLHSTNGALDKYDEAGVVCWEVGMMDRAAQTTLNTHTRFTSPIPLILN